VANHDVSGASQGLERQRIGSRHLLENGRLLRAERRPVTYRTMERVVQPLRDPEELRGRVQHEPANADAQTASVTEERAQHLGNAAARGRRVHVPNGAGPQKIPNRGDPPFERFQPLGAEQRFEGLD
jgi:hypothetical protein